MFENIAPREKLDIQSVNYAWSSIDQIYYRQVFKDEFFYELVEKHLSTPGQIHSAITVLSHNQCLGEISNLNIPDVLSEREYGRLFNPGLKENVKEWIKILACLTKHVTYDCLYVLLKTSVAEFYTVNKPSEEYLEIYKRVKPMIEINARKALSFFIDTHKELGEKIDETTYTLDKSENGLVVLKLFVRLVIRELLFCLMQKDVFTNSEISLSPSDISAVIDVEMLLQPRYDGDDETGEIVFANVKQVMQFMGVPNIKRLDDFARKMIDLSFGAKVVNFGISKSTQQTKTGEINGKTNYGKRIHKSSNRNKMLLSSQTGKRLIQKKSQDGMLTERTRTSTKYSTGGDVFLLVDCTGSTCPRGNSYGVINLEEVICSAIADACRKNNRKLTVYFYNEGTNKTLSFSPTEPIKNFNQRKIELYGNGAYKGNNEVKTFQEVFYEISRQQGKKHSVIFMSDGGVLYGSDGDRLDNAMKVKANLAQYAKSIEVLPLLISPSTDSAFNMIFDGYQIMHIEDINEFDFSHLEKCIKFVNKNENE